MKYLEPSFSEPAAPKMKDGRNRHGQTWDDIFGTPSKGNADTEKVLARLAPHWREHLADPHVIERIVQAMKAVNSVFPLGVTNTTKFYASRKK